jgi:hypothetical protein
LASKEDELAAGWQNSASAEQQLHGHLALAVMNDELGRTAEAVSHYEAAREQLGQLSANSPEAMHYAAALADCYRQLSRLRASQDRKAAEVELERGRAMSQRLANEQSDPRLHAEWLETEMDAIILGGGSPDAEKMDRFQQIESKFWQMVPQDPVKLYELACFLGGREPILVTRKPSD